MKKLAELAIGNQIVANDMYENYGSPTLFITFKDDKRERNYFRHGYYQARCINCGALYTVKPYSVWSSHAAVTCPACGRLHTGNAVMYGDNPESLLPDNSIMKVIDFKDKVELRIKYTAVYFGRFAYKTYKYLKNITETYVFDVKNSKCLWCKKQDGKEIEKREIGYFEDFFKLREKTALWFYRSDHKINKGNSFAELLKILRTAVNKKIKANGKTPKQLYIGGNFNNRLFGNVLNLAHRVRFWDSENIQALSYGEWAVAKWKNDILGENYLPERFEEQVYLAMRKSDFTAAICKVLKIPNIPHTRRNLQYENFALLRECYKIKNYDVAQAMFNYAKKKGVQAVSKIRDMIDFYNKFISFYPKMQMQYVLSKWDTEYCDILRLWRAADKITKQEFYKKLPAISKLHDWLSIAVAKQADREIIFDVPDEVINRYTMLLKAFGAKCIERNSELKFWATSLSNCAAGYKNIIGEKRQLVGISDDRGKPVALLEINGTSITQAKLFDNDPVYYKENINAIVLEFAEKCGLKIRTRDVLKPGDERQLPVTAIA
mgnify:CR=1 FL=1|jgi:hypothetical protein